MLAMTHGQPATPTTIGKELAVFYNRLKRQTTYIRAHKLQGKLGGATGTWGAHVAAYPSVDWLQFTQRFIKSYKEVDISDDLNDNQQMIISEIVSRDLARLCGEMQGV